VAVSTDATAVLIIGGGVASVRCARTLRRHGFDGRILLVGDERSLPYNRPPLSKELLRDDLPDELVHAEQAAWYERRNVEMRRGTTVTALDVEARTAELWDGTMIGYERCLLATGAAPRTLPVPGGAAVPTLRTLADSRRLRAAALAAASEPVVIVGGGLIGVEVASSLASLGLSPVLLAMDDRLWSGALGDELSSWAVQRLRDGGVEVRLGTRVTEVVDGRVQTATGDVHGTVLLAGVGVEPRTGLAEAAGLEVGDGIVVDDEGRTSDPNVWAAGDVARSGARRDEHWHHARESGERAALSMLGETLPPKRAPWTFSEVAGTSFDVVGDGTGADWEGWARPSSVLLRAARGRVVQVAVVGGEADLGAARELVERGASVSDAERRLSG
jgi:3-phenylpropionate/trans-cinnamate dioxygenase ferredoxin reductase component